MTGEWAKALRRELVGMMQRVMLGQRFIAYARRSEAPPLTPVAYVNGATLIVFGNSHTRGLARHRNLNKRKL
jgi:hypothetical protein